MASENLAGRTVAGYRLLERVGEGGTAEVYRAEHPERGSCAFKVLRQRLRGDPVAVKRFLREAGYGARVSHPGVVHTYDYGEAEGLHYLALEWAEGESLASFVMRSAPVPPLVAASIVRQLGDALGAAHQAGIIHRDLKPENIIYNPATERALLLDFGIARDAELPPEERLTRTGFFVGTLQYVAPEALSGELVDGRADVYSLATIAYYLLTGKHPYTGRNPRELFQQLLREAANPAERSRERPAVSGFARSRRDARLVANPDDRQRTTQALAAEVVAGAATTDTGSGGLSGALKSFVSKRK